MIHQQPNDQTQEWAALYALDALDGEDLQAFEAHLKEGCPSCQAELKDFQSVVNHLRIGAKLVAPPAGLRSKLLAQVGHEKGTETQESQTQPTLTRFERPGLTFVRSADEQWDEVAPGLWLKTLFVDQTQGRVTALARMAPGCKYIAHRHTKPEELYVLEGTCNCAGELLRAGDYHRAEAGSIHYETSTADGCVMLVIFSPDNEMLEPAQT